MGKTIKELLSETGLESAPATEKTASSARSTTEEVDEVLRSLGVESTTAVKTASENVKPNGGSSMKSMDELYNEICGESASTTEKVATAETTTEVVDQTEQNTDESSEDFGALVGGYFNEALAPFTEKVAKDLEAEGSPWHKPLEGIHGDGSLAAVIGKQGDPALEVNHKATGGGKIDAMTGNTGPYSLKDSALAKALLKREKLVPGGAFTD